MRAGYSAVQFLFAVFLLFTGTLLLGIHYSPHLRSFAAEFLRHSSLVTLGLLFLGVGILLMILFYRMCRGVYYEIEMGVSVDPKLIQKYVEKYWKASYPDMKPVIEVLMKRNRIEISMELAQAPSEMEQKLSASEVDLTSLLKEHFGYTCAFRVNVCVAK